MSTFDREEKDLTMDIDSGDQKTTASGDQKTTAAEPPGKREMLASGDEQMKLIMDDDSGNQEPTAAEPMGERELSGSGQEQNKLVMDVDSGDQQHASESVGKRYVTNSLIIVTTAKNQTTEVTLTI